MIEQRQGERPRVRIEVAHPLGYLLHARREAIDAELALEAAADSGWGCVVVATQHDLRWDWRDTRHARSRSRSCSPRQ